MPRAAEAIGPIFDLGSHRLHEVLTNNNTLQEDIFAILVNGSVEIMLQDPMRFD